MLNINHVKKAYNRKKEVLRDIDHIFYEGELHVILGKNGSGRTTLLECISEDVTIDEGIISTKEKSTVFLAMKQSILPMNITGYEFITYLCDMKGKEKLDSKVYLDRVNMQESVRNTLISEMSFEDKKRIQLAAFLVQKPYVYMMDEPFDFRDTSFVDECISILKEECSDTIIIITTGILEIAEKISDNILLLNEGVLEEVPVSTLVVPEVKNAVKQIIGEV